jgi:hypothetical protein
MGGGIDGAGRVKASRARRCAAGRRAGVDRSNSVHCAPRRESGAGRAPSVPTRTTLSECNAFDGNATACNQAWHLSGLGGDPASCYYDTAEGRCRGCGFTNELRDECNNTCR